MAGGTRDLGEALRRRDEAIARAFDNAPRGWRDHAKQAVVRTAISKRQFTADDVWEWLAEFKVKNPRETRAMGGVLRGFSSGSKPIIQAVGAEKSADPVCHGRHKTVWRSLIWVQL